MYNIRTRNVYRYYSTSTLLVQFVFPILIYCECGACQISAPVCACTYTSHPCSITLLSDRAFH